MKWKGRRGSDNVIDSRGKRVASTAGAGALLSFVGRRFGLKGILIMFAVVGVLWVTGLVDPSQFLGGTTQTPSGPIEVTPEEQERFDFVSVVLADTEDVWNAIFAGYGEDYPEPQLEIYRGQVATGCGMGAAQMGPFYCPNDHKLYIDLGFYDELEQSFDAPGDFAQAYVIAHEVGHHVQTLLGDTQKVHARNGQPDYNEWSVRLELQADYYAGVWANHNRHYLDPGDILEAVRAANAIGDDTIQGRTRGRVVPHTFTHGTSEQRMRWFNKGLESGRLEDGDTFSVAYGEL
ncbi:MAG: metalloprotease [Lysobacterales bacterium]|nr:MAG: metalloprotease [Xanthomonadales bacterium]